MIAVMAEGDHTLPRDCSRHLQGVQCLPGPGRIWTAWCSITDDWLVHGAKKTEGDGGGVGRGGNCPYRTTPGPRNSCAKDAEITWYRIPAYG